MFAKPSYRKRTLIGMSTTACIQFSGILVINNYGPLIYSRLGFDTNKQLIYAAAWLTLAWGAGCIALLVVDRMPRPKLIAIGLMGCSVFLILEAALVKNFAGSDNKPALTAAVAMLYIFVVFYEICLDGTQFVYLGEIFPTHLRAKGMSLGCSAIALMNVMWLQVTPIAFDKIGWKFYLCFIIPGILSAIMIWVFYPDTWGLPLEEVAALFGDAEEIYTGPLDEEIEKEMRADHVDVEVKGTEHV